MMSTPAAPLTGDFGMVEQAVRRHAGDFAAYSFEFAGVTLAGSPKLQVFPMFQFINKKTGMAIDISFFAARQGHQGGFNVLIVKPVNRKLSVKDYLEIHGSKDPAQAFNYRDPTTDVQGFAESFLRVLLDLMGKDLRPILEGKAWEETPIDWMGYK